MTMETTLMHAWLQVLTDGKFVISEKFKRDGCDQDQRLLAIILKNQTLQKKFFIDDKIYSNNLSSFIYR